MSVICLPSVNKVPFIFSIYQYYRELGVIRVTRKQNEFWPPEQGRQLALGT